MTSETSDVETQYVVTMSAAILLSMVRNHPEYQAMQANLSNTQRRCGVLLEALRAVKAFIFLRCVSGIGLSQPATSQLLQDVNDALNPPQAA